MSLCLPLICLMTTAMVDREADARLHTEPALRTACERLGVAYPPQSVFLRAFKQEKSLEVWIQGKEGAYKKLESLTIVAASGGPGPKRREGDKQVPEGVYVVDRFNPLSAYHLSMGINYPNASDKLRSDSAKPGGDIFIHGSNVSIGCMALTDPVIERLYTLCRSVKNPVAVHIFPCVMSKSNIAELVKADFTHMMFWKELQPIYDHFEKNRTLPAIRFGRHGEYRMSS